jgi:signal transduction histidine kinase
MGVMTGLLPLDWGIIAVSLFNTLLILWIGSMVWLAAERRNIGLYLSVGALLLGAAFFVVHTAVAGHNMGQPALSLGFWWRAGWALVIVQPFSWYGTMLWHSGFWAARSSPLRRRHRIWLVLASLVTVALLVGLAITPTIAIPTSRYPVYPAQSGFSERLLMIFYLPYAFACIILAIDALRHPGATSRMMGDIARRRARPWLIRASFVLLLVGVIAGWAMRELTMGTSSFDARSPIEMIVRMAWFDLVISSLIAVVIVLVGQAIISYEVFTGRTLPRRGLKRLWLTAIVLSGGYALVVGFCIATDLTPVYSLLISGSLMMIFFAVSGWRSFAEREQSIAVLRPFVSSQGLYGQLVGGMGIDGEIDMAAPLATLCRDILGAGRAWLLTTGPLAPFAPEMVVYPADVSREIPSIGELAPLLRSSGALCTQLDPAEYAGAVWGIPLWSERGLIGALLLGEKSDGGLYTQEEIEIARASCERLIDTAATVEMARRLISLQRQRMAESGVLDRRTRRVLHDEITPRLHALMLELSAGDTTSNRNAIEGLADVHRAISDLLRDLPPPTDHELVRSGLPAALRRMIERELSDAFDAVDWKIDPEAEAIALELPPVTSEVLYYAAREAIRNAARYARDAARPLNLAITISASPTLRITIEDDGAGISPDKPTRPGGGHGLALHSTMLAVIGGSLEIDSRVGGGTVVRIRL